MTLALRLFPTLLLVAAACGTVGGAELTLKNVGAVSMTDVIVSTTGRQYPIGELRPGQTRAVRVCADDDSNITVEHGAPSSRRRFTLEVYLDHHCTGSVNALVTADSLVSSEWTP